jgi:hypothetical protein
VRNEPTFLANLSVNGNDEHFSPACIAILSEPLPADLPLPASVYSLLISIFESIVISTSSLTKIRYAYSLLDGAASNVVTQLLDDEREQIVDHLCKLLKQVNIKQDPELQLLCIWIICKLGAPLNKTAPWLSETARTIVCGQNGVRTMNLLVISVIWACKKGIEITHQQAVERVKLASEILHTVDMNIRQSWAMQNTRYSTKLVEKAIQEGMHPELQIMVYSYCSSYMEVTDCLGPQVHRPSPEAVELDQT